MKLFAADALTPDGWKRDVAIDVNCIFEGRVTLGNGVKVGANCILREVTVGEGTEMRVILPVGGAARLRSSRPEPVQEQLE